MSTPTAINIHFRFCIPSPSSVSAISFRRIAAKSSMGSRGTFTPVSDASKAADDSTHTHHNGAVAVISHNCQLATWMRRILEGDATGVHPLESNRHGTADRAPGALEMSRLASTDSKCPGYR